LLIAVLKGGQTMQRIVAFWCELLGFSDPLAVNIAGGMVAGATLLIAAYMALALVLWALTGMTTRAARL
jgi:hypothetical protein